LGLEVLLLVVDLDDEEESDELEELEDTEELLLLLDLLSDLSDFWDFDSPLESDAEDSALGWAPAAFFFPSLP